MAQTMICDGCSEIEAVLMVTQIGTGQIQAFCPVCSVTWAEVYALTIREVMGLPSATADQAADDTSGQEATGDNTAPTSPPDTADGATMDGDHPVTVTTDQKGN